MTKGAMAAGLDEGIEHLNHEQKLLLCAKEVIKALPSRKLEEVHQQDDEEATREKVMAEDRRCYSK